MDIKAQIEKLVDKVKNDKETQKLFKENPEKAVEKVLGVDLPDDVVKKVIDGVKAAVTADGAKNVLGSLKGMLGK